MTYLKKIYNRLFSKLNWILLSIIFLGALLRLAYLGSIPSGLHFDEAQSGYNAFMLSKHLKNIHGQFLPTDIDYFQDYRPAANSYFTAMTVATFGLNETTIRLPAAIFGILTIYLIYIISLKIFKKKEVGYLASFLTAISPYHVNFSRASTDGIIDLFWVLFSLTLALIFLETKKKTSLLIVYFNLILSFFTYQTSRFMAPVLLLSLVIIHFNFYKLKTSGYKWLLLILIIYFIFPWGYFALKGKTGARFNQVSTFSSPNVQRQINELITESGTLKIPIIITRILHNKPLGYFQDISIRHLSFFSPSIVLSDTTRPSRYRIPSMGLFTIAEFTGLLLGLYFLFRFKGNNLKWFILFALLIAPLPSSITFDDFPNFQRALYLIPFWEILAGFGIYNMFKALKNNKILILSAFTLILSFQFMFFAYQYFLISPIHEPFYRNYSEKELAFFLNDDTNKKYNKIGISDNRGTYIFYLLFNKLDIFKINVKKEGKYFQNNFSLSNLVFTKNRCLGTGDYLQEEYSLAIQFEDCKTFSFNEPIHYFRRKDNSLELIAYKTNTKLFDEFKIRHKNLLDCRIEVFRNYNIQTTEDIENFSDKKTNEKITKELLDCDTTYYVD
jgi:4-amino-4-deoxy-L-arabinose transferase-like glycosyltransferase